MCLYWYCCRSSVQFLPFSLSTLPAYAHHGVGVGGFVVNDENKILVVQEKNGPITNIWKLPGGMVDQGEPIATAVERELMEETGIKAEFQCIAGAMETSPGPFNTTSLYLICVCKPLSSTIHMQEREIQDCKWMDVEEFLNLPYWQKAKGWLNFFKAALECTKSDSKGWEKQSFKMFHRTARTYMPTLQKNDNKNDQRSRL
mmetsp:Transcript_4415/g.6616  ORF Transcript_4415/g.6616 Transcript_4415/m.6616 type:complete len:201 (-) Transcript_4415:40-642(-)